MPPPKNSINALKTGASGATSENNGPLDVMNAAFLEAADDADDPI